MKVFIFKLIQLVKIYYLVAIYILTKVIIEKSATDVSLMKIMGYDTKSVAKLYLVGVSICVLYSLFVCLPLDYLAFKFIFDIAMQYISGYLKVSIPYYIYLIMILFGVVSYCVLALFHYLRINKIKMSDALKNRE